jgi:hypothetical protein
MGKNREERLWTYGTILIFRPRNRNFMRKLAKAVAKDGAAYSIYSQGLCKIMRLFSPPCLLPPRSRSMYHSLHIHATS